MDIISEMSNYCNAMEGVLSSRIRIENIDKLNDRLPLMIFSTDSTALYGGISVLEFVRRYRFNTSTDINLDKLLDYFVYGNGNLDEICHNSQICKLFGDSHYLKVSDDMTIGDFINDIIVVTQLYSRESNELICFVTNDTFMYGYNVTRTLPVIVANLSILSRIKNIKTSTLTIGDFIKKHHEFQTIDTKLRHPKWIDPMSLDLFHISPDPTIKTLTPRISTKTLDRENRAIPRISAAATIKDCIIAVNVMADDTLYTKRIMTYYVYRLMLTPDSLVVQPSRKLVPDAKETGEVWVLNDTDVECIGTVEIRISDDNKSYSATPRISMQ